MFEELPLVDNGRAAPGDGEIITTGNRTIRVGRRPRATSEAAPVDRRTPIRLSLLWTRAAPGVAQRGGPSIARLTDAEALQLADDLRTAATGAAPATTKEKTMTDEPNSTDGLVRLADGPVYKFRLSTVRPGEGWSEIMTEQATVDPVVMAATLRAAADQLDPPRPVHRRREGEPLLRGQRAAEPNPGDFLISDGSGPLRALDPLTHEETWRRGQPEGGDEEAARLVRMQTAINEMRAEVDGPRPEAYPLEGLPSLETFKARRRGQRS